MLRACDVMQQRSSRSTGQDEPIREAGLAMARADLELVPVVDDDGALTGVVTERALARRYIRESRHTSTLEDAPTYVQRDRRRCSTESSSPARTDQLDGRVWVHSMDVASPSGISDGRRRRGRQPRRRPAAAIDLGAALLVLSTAPARPTRCWSSHAERGTAIIVSPLDSYVSGRMITLAAPCRALMEHDPLTVTADVPARRHLRADQGDPLRRGGRRSTPTAARWAGHPLRSRRPAAAGA